MMLRTTPPALVTDYDRTDHTDAKASAAFRERLAYVDLEMHIWRDHVHAASHALQEGSGYVARVFDYLTSLANRVPK